MSVGALLAERSEGVPEALQLRINEALGKESEAPRLQAADVCLNAAVRLLDSLVRERRFGRESAIDLLAVDALMTYAYEFASTSGTERLTDLAHDGVRAVAGLAHT